MEEERDETIPVVRVWELEMICGQQPRICFIQRRRWAYLISGSSTWLFGFSSYVSPIPLQRVNRMKVVWYQMSNVWFCCNSRKTRDSGPPKGIYTSLMNMQLHHLAISHVITLSLKFMTFNGSFLLCLAKFGLLKTEWNQKYSSTSFGSILAQEPRDCHFLSAVVESLLERER